MMSKIETQHYPPQHCGYCEQTHDATKCDKPPKTYHLSAFCTYDQCVEGWWDYFDQNMIYLFTKPCVICLPDTWEYVQQYPKEASQTGTDGLRLGRSLATQRRMQDKRSEYLINAYPELTKGKKK